MNKSKFWQEFQLNHQAWALLYRKGDPSSAFEAIDELASVCQLPYCFDITQIEGRMCLIFSPEGDVDEANAIDELIQCAPKGHDWNILGRRQRKPIADVAAILRQLFQINLEEVRFSLDDRYTLAIELPAAQEYDDGFVEGFGDTFLWHSLGEEFVMTNKIKCRKADTNSLATLLASDVVKFYDVALPT